MSLNIPSSVDDPNYRYKMPKLRAKIEGKGNGIKTNIYNMGDIARALKRSPEYVTKFCGHELGAQSKFDINEGKAIVNGAHFEHDLQNLIDKFCEKFVLCPNCRLPEIDLVVKNRVRCACNACGFTGDLDNAHKLATYIVKYPPQDGTESTMGKKGSKKEKSKEDRQKEVESAEGGVKKEKKEKDKDKDKEKKHKKDKDGEKGEKGEKSEKSEKKKKGLKVSASDVSESVDLGSDGEPVVKAKHHKHKSALKPGASSDFGGEEKTEKSEKLEKPEKSKKSKSKKDKEKTEVLAREGLAFDSEETAQIARRLIVVLRGEGFLKSSAASTDDADGDAKDFIITPAEFFQEIRLLQVSQEFDSSVRAYVALASLFPARINVTALKQRLPYLRAVCDRSVTGTDICVGVVHYLTRIAPKSLEEAPYVLSELYQQDLLEEDDLNMFFDEEGPFMAEEAVKTVRSVSESFLSWLAGASSDSSDENDEEVDSEVSSTQTAGQTAHTVGVPCSSVQSAQMGGGPPKSVGTVGQRYKALGTIASTAKGTDKDKQSEESESSDIDINDL